MKKTIEFLERIFPEANMITASNHKPGYWLAYNNLGSVFVASEECEPQKYKEVWFKKTKVCLDCDHTDDPHTVTYEDYDLEEKTDEELKNEMIEFEQNLKIKVANELKNFRKYKDGESIIITIINN